MYLVWAYVHVKQVFCDKVHRSDQEVDGFNFSRLFCSKRKRKRIGKKFQAHGFFFFLNVQNPQAYLLHKTAAHRPF